MEKEYDNTEHKLWMNISVEDFIIFMDWFISFLNYSVELWDEGGLSKCDEQLINVTVVEGWDRFKKFVKDHARDGFYRDRDSV